MREEYTAMSTPRTKVATPPSVKLSSPKLHDAASNSRIRLATGFHNWKTVSVM